MLAYADVTLVVLDDKHTDLVITTVKDYENATGTRVNPEKRAGLHLGTCRSKSVPTSALYVVGRSGP